MICRAFLFDLDGVLVDSRAAHERIWRAWAGRRGIDADRLVRLAHGRRTSETLRAIAPDLDIPAEVAFLDAMEERERAGIVAAPGALDLVSALPPHAWAIVTSGSRSVATLRLSVSGLPIPPVFVTGDSVERGKPDPQGYLRAAAALGVTPADAIVLEDAPPGVAAGKAAGMRVVAVASTHAPESLSDADVVVGALDLLEIVLQPGGWIEVSVTG